MNSGECWRKYCSILPAFHLVHTTCRPTSSVQTHQQDENTTNNNTTNNAFNTDLVKKLAAKRRPGAKGGDPSRGKKAGGAGKKRGARNWDDKKDAPQLDFSNDAGVGVWVCLYIYTTHMYRYPVYAHPSIHPHHPRSPPTAPGAAPTQPTVDYQQRSRVDVEDELPEEYAELLLEDAGEGSGDAPSGVLAGFVRSLGVNVLGTQALTAGDIAPALEAMKKKLMERNVAADIADKCVWMMGCCWCCCGVGEEGGIGIELCVYRF